MTTRPYIALLLLVFSACTAEKRDRRENILVAHIATNPKGLHITNNADQPGQKIFSLTQKTLYQMDIRTMEYVPVLLKEMPTLNETTGEYDCYLRQDIQWDDGSSLTANDIAFSAKVGKCPLTNNPAYRGMFNDVIDSIRLDPENPYHFTFVPNGPNILNKSVFSQMYILQKEFWDRDGITENLHFSSFGSENFETSPDIEAWFDYFNDESNGRDLKKLVGLGAYQVTEWQQDEQIVLERKKDWWGKEDTLIYNKAYPSKIIFRVVKSDQNTVLDLKKEKLDVTDRLGTRYLMELREDEDFNNNYYSRFLPMFGYMYIAMNMRPNGVDHKPIFSDRRVRRAFAHCVPVDDIIQTILHGKGYRQVANVSPLKDYYNEQLEPLPLDIERAKELLDDAGWVDSDGDNTRDKMIDGAKVDLRFKVAYQSIVDDYKTILLMVRDEAYKAGMEVILDPMDMNRWQEAALSQDFDAIMGSWSGSADYQDPSQLWHTSSWANHGMNFCGFGNAESDSLIQNTVNTNSPQHYKLGMQKLQEMIYREQPYVFMYQPSTKIAVHKRFKKPGMYAEKPVVILQSFQLKEE